LFSVDEFTCVPSLEVFNASPTTLPFSVDESKIYSETTTLQTTTNTHLLTSPDRCAVLDAQAADMVQCCCAASCSRQLHTSAVICGLVWRRSLCCIVPVHLDFMRTAVRRIWSPCSNQLQMPPVHSRAPRQSAKHTRRNSHLLVQIIARFVICMQKFLSCRDLPHAGTFSRTETFESKHKKTHQCQSRRRRQRGRCSRALDRSVRHLHRKPCASHVYAPTIVQ